MSRFIRLPSILLLGTLLLLVPTGCNRTAPPTSRLVAFGDVHGDLGATLDALKLAGVVDARGTWIGGTTTVVQTGDWMDRGADEKAILELFTRLTAEAEAAGGRLIVLNGNHELLNAELDLRNVSEGGFADFSDTPLPAAPDTLLSAYPTRQRGRVQAFRPGGPFADRLAGHPLILQLDDNLFVHGGVLPEHVDYGLDRLNDETSAWMLGQTDMPAWMHTRRSPEWARNFSDAPDSCDCDTLSMVLDAVGAQRMIVGHTVQDGGIQSHCDGRIWCLDTGNSLHYGGPTGVLEIVDGRPHILRGPDPVVRAQKDTIGFAVNREDMQRVLEACRPPAVEDPPTWTCAIMPHDDYLYAGPTAAALLPGLKADTWIIVGVCHACRRVGLRDQIIFDDADAWDVAGHRFPVDVRLRDRLMAELGQDGFAVDMERHADEHSIEALLPWLEAAVPGVRFVPLLVSGMELPDIQDRANRMGDVLADLCRDVGWVPGRDIGILISADAVHYGCNGWGARPYAPFGCEAEGHEAAVLQDIQLANTVLSGPVSDESISAFCDQVWDRENPDYPQYPYRITWCGLYSIPFGLTLAQRLQTDLNHAPLRGSLIRYGDSVSDRRLELLVDKLGVTAPNTLAHWVGYPALGYQ